MNSTAAVFAAAVTTLLLVENIKGIEESSDKALRVMQITTVMVVVLLRLGQLLCPCPRRAPSSTAHSFEPEVQRRCPRLPQRNSGLPIMGLFGIIMAFGHSILAMSGEESLAQVNREIEHPKLKNLKRAAIVIAIYSLIFTGGGTLLASMLIPGYGADAHLPGQPHRRHGDVHGWAHPSCALHSASSWLSSDFLILSGAINTSMIGSTGVLMRVAEDGVLTDWFRKPHPRFGTSYRIVNLVCGLQMFTIIVTRGNIITLGEAYAFGVIWSFTFNSLAMLVLRWKYHGERGWKVPPNMRIGKTEIPVGLFCVFLVLLSTATVNLFTKSIATVSGMIFAAGFFVIFSVSERQNLRKHAADRPADEGPFPTRAPGHHQQGVSGHTARRRDGHNARCCKSHRAEMGACPHQDGGSRRRSHERAHDGRRADRSI